MIDYRGCSISNRGKSLLPLALMETYNGQVNVTDVAGKKKIKKKVGVIQEL